MTESNIISISITLFAIAAGSLFNNVRISDSNTALNKRIDDLRDFIRSENGRVVDFIHAENSRIDQKLDRISETLAAVIGDHEQRIRTLEHQPG